MMVHRRMVFDDSRGVREPLNEIDANGDGILVKTKHIVIFGSAKDFRKELPRKVQFVLD